MINESILNERNMQYNCVAVKKEIKGSFLIALDQQKKNHNKENLFF